MAWSTIPTRSNGQRVLYTWFNNIKTLVDEIIAFLGGGSIQETEFSIANNTGPSNVTGLTIDGATYRGGYIDYTLYRKTDNAEYVRTGILFLGYKTVANSWEITDIGTGDAGVEFTCTAAGQIQYTSENISGSNYTGTMVFKLRTTTKES